MPKREVPFSPLPTPHGTNSDQVDGAAQLFEPEGARVHETRPVNEFAALLEARPFEEPDWSRAELLPLRDRIQDALELVLTERERYIFDAIVIERQSLRQLAARTAISKSQIDRIHKAAIVKVRDVLQDDPLIKEYLTR